MRKWALLSSLLGACALTGCYIEAEDWDDDWEDWDDDEGRSTGGVGDRPSTDDRGREVCEPYCLKLVQCEAISDSALRACIDLCGDRFEDDEDGVTEGCSCVLDAQCGSSEISSCEGDPIPGVWNGGDDDLDPGGGGAPGDDDDHGPGGSGDGTGGQGTSGGKTCSSNHECPLASDCIEGTCQARCAASCQCDEGEACVEGYCQLPEEPAAECDDDCDCTSGERCVEGLCG